MTTQSDGGGGPLRILVVNWLDRENPQSGGAETHLHQIFGRLVAKGHQVTALTSGWSGCASRASLDGIDVHRAGRRYTFSLAAPLYYRRHLAADGFGVVVEDLNKVPLFTPFWTRAPRVLLVHHLFGATAFREARPPLALATWLLERPVPYVFRATQTVAVSESTRADLVRRGMRPEAIEVIHNGLDLTRYASEAPVDRAERPTLLYVGRVKRYKGIDLVIRAVRALSNDGLDVRLLVAGTGDYSRALVRLTERLGVQDRVTFLGFVTEERKLELLRSAWIHVLSSPKEGWGITCLEAAACGTPTVASDSPGLRDAVVDGETGLLAPHGDVAALAQRIAALLRDDALREAMGRRAREFAARFGWDGSAEALEKLLRRVVGRSHPG